MGQLEVAACEELARGLDRACDCSGHGCNLIPVLCFLFFCQVVDCRSLPSRSHGHIAGLADYLVGDGVGVTAVFTRSGFPFDGHTEIGDVGVDVQRNHGSVGADEGADGNGERLGVSDGGRNHQVGHSGGRNRNLDILHFGAGSGGAAGEGCRRSLDVICEVAREIAALDVFRGHREVQRSLKSCAYRRHPDICRRFGSAG